MVHAQALHLVHGQQHTSKEQLVLLLQWQRESVDDRTQDLQQFGNTIVPLGFVHELEENVVDRAPNI